MSRRPVLIFDFGNVVAHFDYGRAAEACARPLGITGRAFSGRMERAGFQGLLRDYERGALTSDQFADAFLTRASLSIAYDDFVRIWTDIFTLNEPTARLIPALKAAGYTLVLGSNTNELHARWFRAEYAATLGHFDELVLSYQVGALKPERAFYEACVQAARAPASSCIFIDDIEENVAGARAAGLQALHYRSGSILTDELEALGIRVGVDEADRAV